MRRRLRIFVPSAATLLTDHRGHGEGLIAWNLLSGLAARGHEIVACARQVDLSTAAPFEAVEIGLASRLESLESLAYTASVQRLYSRLGGSRRFDLAHWLFPQGPQELLGSVRGVPVVVGPHMLLWPASSANRRAGDLVRMALTPLFKTLHRRALAQAACLLVATPDAAAIFPQAHRSKVRVLPFGIDESDAAPWADGARDPTITFVGRLEPEKNVLKLVEAFALVREHVPGVTLVVAGDGSERGSLEEHRTRLGLADSVKLLGPVSHDRIPELLRSSSIVCLPSDGEPYGMAVLEAMAAGRAVVTRDCGGPRFLLAHDKGEQLVAGGDAGSLADALTRLLGDGKALERIGRQNRERVESTFTLSRMIDELESIYESVR